MRYVGSYLDELNCEELGGVTVKRMESRVEGATRELVIRERDVDGVTEITVTSVLTAPAK